jgi:hypothetical protein
MRRYYNFVLMVIWLGIAFILLDPIEIVPEKLRQQFGGAMQLPVALLALTFAAYNGVRWWSYRALYQVRATGQVNPLAVRKRIPTGEHDEEPNPAFDFSKAPELEPPSTPALDRDNPT